MPDANPLEPPLNWDEMTRELLYRNAEFIGISCEDREPTADDLRRAEQYCREWKERYERECSS